MLDAKSCDCGQCQEGSLGQTGYLTGVAMKAKERSSSLGTWESSQHTSGAYELWLFFFFQDSAGVWMGGESSSQPH